MANKRLTIGLPSEAGIAPGAALVPSDQEKPQITLQFLDGTNAELGAPVLADTPLAAPVEGRGEGVIPHWSLTTPPLSLDIDVPDGARAVAVSSPAMPRSVFTLDAVALDATIPILQRKERLGRPDARWILAVVSERFTDPERFFAHCRTLHAFIGSQSPFSDADVSFAIDALFWPSSPGETLFGASDDKINGRVLQGDGERVKRFVSSAGITPSKILVVIDSLKRAGAGGRQSEIPSWTTNSADPPERWEGIALHELGHAFGLADEYDTAFQLDEPTPLEPNVSSQADPGATSWAHLSNVSAPPSPTSLRGHESAHDLATVGTFQGARYRPEDRYRPSPFCRMRMTTVPFCAVCRAHIRDVLTS